MRTDTIFYQLFLTFHSLLFELLVQPLENADYYQFTSAEIKEKSFRFDGIFMPNREDKPMGASHLCNEYKYSCQKSGCSKAFKIA